MRRSLALAAVAALLAAPATAHAAPEDVANAVAREVMSPYCPGVTLHDCPSSSAQEMRVEIAEWARDGMTKDEIVARLEGEFGPSIRAVPSGGGGLFAWLLPAAALLAGVAAAFVLARRWARRRPDAAAVAAPASPEAAARLNAELDRLRAES
ncbi:MAG TPA: cytochrome c-type biogenesis protein CcmH [Actinomycetota bacterium]|nr:cytochrome c-type biogenesis protein CcmH [Actinomycetota bacterium]